MRCLTCSSALVPRQLRSRCATRGWLSTSAMRSPSSATLLRFNPAAVQVIENQQGGKLCAIPTELNIEGFWYNLKIFSDNGITPP
jgi:hypothetical protein